MKPRPKTPGLRHKIVLKKISPFNFKFKWQQIIKKKPHGISKINGILLYSRKKQKFIKSINFLEKKYMINKLGLVINFLNNYNNKTYCSLIKYANGAFSNIHSTHGLLPGSFIKTTNLNKSKFNRLYLGDTILLFWIKRKMVFYNIFILEKNKIVFSKAAGTFCSIVYNDKEKNYSKIKLPSGEEKIIYNYTFVTLGRNSNIFTKSIVYGKAGITSNNGFKSSVRGVAMNPVDHPHGGRTKTNSPEKTPWGKVAKLNK